MSRIGKTKDVLSRPKSEVAAEAGDRLLAEKKTPNMQVSAPKKSVVVGTQKPILHRASLSFDPSKTAFGASLDGFMDEIEKKTRGLGVKGPKATAVLSRFFIDNDEALADLLSKHLNNIRD